MRYWRFGAVLFIFALGVAFAARGATADEHDRFYDLNSTGGNIIDKVAVGPGSVFFVGINPLRYPAWTMSINDNIIAGPKPNLASAFSGNSLSPQDVTFTPIPSPAPTSSIESLPDPVPSATPSGLGTTADCILSVAATIVVADQCIAQSYDQLRLVERIIYEDIDQFRRMSAKYGTMWKNADRVVQDAGTLKTRKQYDDYIVNVQQTFEIARSEFLTDFYQLRPWPVQELGQLDANIKALTSFVNDRKTKDQQQKSTATSQLTTLKAEITQDTSMVAAYRKHASDYASQIDSLTKQIAADNKKVATFTASENAANQELAALPQYLAKIADLQASDSRYAYDGVAGMAYRNAVTTTSVLVQQRVLPATADRFAYFNEVDCHGLAGGSREKDYVLSLGDGRGAQVRMICQSKMFISYGVAFSGLAQATYNTVAVPSPAPPIAPGSLEIIAQTQNLIRATPMVLNNVQLGEDVNDHGFYGSFGAGLSNGGSGTNVEYLAGLSYSLSRVMVLTTGLQYGPEQNLPHGYYEGQILPPGGSAPGTVTQTKPDLFLGISFGSTGP